MSRFCSTSYISPAPEIGALQHFRFRLTCLAYLFVRSRGAGVVFLAAKQIAKAKTCPLIMRVVATVFSSLPDSSIDSCRLLVAACRPQQIPFFHRQ